MSENKQYRIGERQRKHCIIATISSTSQHMDYIWSHDECYKKQDKFGEKYMTTDNTLPTACMVEYDQTTTIVLYTLYTLN